MPEAMLRVASRYTAIAALAIGLSSLVANDATADERIAVRNGSVFTGDGFERRDLFIQDGNFVVALDGPPDQVIDATGKFVVPPYGDAHTHNLDREWQLGFLPALYLAEGTFYIQNLTSKTANIMRFREFFSSVDTPDVAFSHQGLTSTLGHPFLAYEPFAMGINDIDAQRERRDEIKLSRIDEGVSYIFLDTEADVRAKLPAFFEAGPDVVKIFLVDVDRFDELSTNDAAGDSGLSRDIAELVVTEAKARGLRVYAHIDTAADFELAVQIGVDGVAHMPTWTGDPDTKERYLVDDAILQEAGARGLVMTPTLSITGFGRPEAFTEPRAAFSRDFIARFRAAGGIVAAGSDRFGLTLEPELAAWREADLFTGLETLQILAIDTPRAIFPDRKIGSLEPGHEGSLLILDRDPTTDLEALGEINTAIKQGVVLPRPEGANDR